MNEALGRLVIEKTIDANQSFCHSKALVNKGTIPQSTQSTLQIMEHAALSAGFHLVNRVETNTPITFARKSDNTLVLSLDLESQEICKNYLNEHGEWVSEEVESSHSLIGSSQDYFLIDPLDGTTSCKRFLNLKGGQVGFGPLIGRVENGILVSCCFYHLPRRTLYTAIRNGGCFACAIEPGSKPPALLERRKVLAEQPQRILDCAVLFYPGAAGELDLLRYLRVNDLIENAYRFGGFANDCSRLAEGYEQIQIQYAVKAWDFPAALLAVEAGLDAIIDPLEKSVNFYDWKVQVSNPILTFPSNIRDSLIKAIE